MPSIHLYPKKIIDVSGIFRKKPLLMFHFVALILSQNVYHCVTFITLQNKFKMAYLSEILDE
jgi:hypothetical protein